MVRKTKRNMEKLVTIIDQFPLASRPYTAQDGTQKVFNSRGFILSDGIDEFYAEMTGDSGTRCRATCASVRSKTRTG